jgi:hypothetical protein
MFHKKHANLMYSLSIDTLNKQHIFKSFSGMIGFMPAPFCNAVIFVNMHVLAIEEELSLGLSS